MANDKIMYKVIAEYDNGLVREMYVDFEAWEAIVQVALEQNEHVTNYRVERQ